MLMTAQQLKREKAKIARECLEERECQLAEMLLGHEK